MADRQGRGRVLPCRRENDDVILHVEGNVPPVRLPFLRQQIRKSRDRANFCLADFIDHDGDWLGGFAVGMHGISAALVSCSPGA